MLFELLTKRYPGMRWWLAQRITAVVMAVYLVLAVLLFIVNTPHDFASWQQFWQPVWWRLMTWAFFAGLVIHAWLGVRDVMRDYVFNLTLRTWLQALVEVVLIGYLVWLGMVLWR